MLKPVVWIEAAHALSPGVQFLRDRAKRLRKLANAHRTALSEQLRKMAAELEQRADELQGQQDRQASYD
jgi:hypothetical protein